MKEVYSFNIEREIESPDKVKKKVNHKVIFIKPHMSKIEEAEFFYGQKFNEYINAGFFTRAMLNKKMGDIGGFASKSSVESLQKAIMDNIEASRVIEFYGSSKDLTEEQEVLLEDAKQTFVSTQTSVAEYEQAVRSQFSQTADVKAEQKLIEWLVFHLSYYEEEVDGKKQFFPLFGGDSFEDKRNVYLDLCENLEDIINPNLFKVKAIFDKSFETLVRVASIWYNKIAENQEDIKKALDNMFGEPEPEKEPKKTKPKKVKPDGETGTPKEG